MSSNLWIKLWVEILDDPKISKFPDWLFRYFIYLLLIAKEYDHDGLLQPVPELAWRLRLREEQITETLRALTEVGVVCEDAGNYRIKNFSKRQAIPSSALRVKKFREKQKSQSIVTKCNALPDALQDSSSGSDSLSLSTFQIYENEIGVITKTIADEIILYENELGEKWMIDAIREASKASGRSWNYVKAILNRWKIQGNQNDMRTKKEESKPKEIIIDPDGGMYL
jgi:DnaD/phage-associated family protein